MSECRPNGDIAVYENGTYLPGSMLRISMKDMWGMAVHEGNTYHLYPDNCWVAVTVTCTHLTPTSSKDRNAEVKVAATDRYNNKYESSEFTTDVTVEGVSLKRESPF